MNKNKVIKALHELLSEDEGLKRSLADKLEGVNESSISQEAYILSRLTDAAQGSSQSFIDNNKDVDFKKLTNDLVRKLEMSRYEVRDVINGTADDAFKKKFYRLYTKSKNNMNEVQLTSVNINMDQAESIHKVLVDNFGKEHIEDMFTLGALSLYNMLVEGGVAGIQEENKEMSEETGYSPQMGKTPGLTPEVLNQILKIIADDADDMNEEAGKDTTNLQKTADQLQTKYQDLNFIVKPDRISVRGNKYKLQDFVKANSKGIGKYKVSVEDQDGRDDTVSISELLEEKPGLWSNIRAKQDRGEKPARKGSKAFKIAKAAGDKINKSN